MPGSRSLRRSSNSVELVTYPLSSESHGAPDSSRGTHSVLMHRMICSMTSSNGATMEFAASISQKSHVSLIAIFLIYSFKPLSSKQFSHTFPYTSSKPRPCSSIILCLARPIIILIFPFKCSKNTKYLFNGSSCFKRSLSEIVQAIHTGTYPLPG